MMGRASKGIQVNCIAPGFMRTTITAQYQDDARMTEYLMIRVPMGRWGEPRDLVSAMLFLCVPGNAFTSGACVVVDESQRDSGGRDTAGSRHRSWTPDPQWNA